MLYMSTVFPVDRFDPGLKSRKVLLLIAADTSKANLFCIVCITHVFWFLTDNVPDGLHA